MKQGPGQFRYHRATALCEWNGGKVEGGAKVVLYIGNRYFLVNLRIIPFLTNGFLNNASNGNEGINILYLIMLVKLNFQRLIF